MSREIKEDHVDIRLDQMGEPADNTDLDTSAARHGLCPKLSGDSNDALKGDGTWGSPAGGGPNLFFNDDHEFTEPGTTYDEKYSFRVVLDSANKPVSWRVVCSLWITGGGGDTASLEVDIGGDTVEITATEVSETVKNGDITITASADTILTASISLKVVGAGGDTAHVKYLDLYAIV